MNIHIQNYLQELRSLRNFNTEEYIQKKIKAINTFFRSEGLDSVVIGLSGGIDSAVVLALYIEASKVPNSPLKKIVGLAMPIYSKGSTGQDDALKRACLLADLYFSEYKFEYKIADLSNACAAYEATTKEDYNQFAVGQLLSIVRTPYIYFHAAILQTKGFKSIVSGTTNRDEGGYIGFFGKASDGMNDIQPIADLHKSEVYKVAKHLNIPIEIINEKPKGDVWDGRNDEEMIGANYDYIELYALLKDYDAIIMFADDETDKAFENIEKIHKTNIHKYRIDGDFLEPLGYSKYVDILNRKIKK